MRTKVALAILLTTSLLIGLGCTTSVVGPEGQTAATYRFGKLKDTLSTDISTAYEASVQAVEDLGLKVTQANQDKLQGRIVARTVEDEKIEIDLTSVTENVTKVTIDTGSLASARRIYRAILLNAGGTTAQGF